jgi:uncharacterized protein (TIGR03067 family)
VLVDAQRWARCVCGPAEARCEEGLTMPAMLAPLCCLYLAAPPPGLAAEGRLQGEWSLASTADVRRADAGSSGFRMAIRADGRVTFRINRLATNQGVFSVGPQGRPRPIDLKLADGRTLLGVFELEDDELVICFEEAGKARPVGLLPTGTQWSERWRRTER